MFLAFCKTVARILNCRDCCSKCSHT